MGFQFCPHCGGKLPSENGAERSASQGGDTGSPVRVYDGPKYWRNLIERSALNRHQPLDVSRAIKRISEESIKAPSFDGIVHLLFDRDIAPHGGVFREAARILATPNVRKAGPEQEMRDDYLKIHGYVVEDGKVKTVNDVPIGRAYLVLEGWAGKERYGDWNMAAPIDLEPSRSGNPYFFDENMIAFGVHFSRRDDIEVALDALANRLELEGAGGLVDIGVFWR